MANLSGGGCNLNEKGCSKQTDKKLDTFDWLCDIPESQSATDLVEVTFKNTRKGYFRNTNGLKLEKGDVVAVESTPGHDIGTVSLTGQLVLLQMRKNHVDPARVEIKRVYRKARPVDLEKYEEAKAREHETMLRARKIAEDLKLNMKIGDVEYQGDGNKAIFYYIADERVDFRQLIKVLADAFKVRIEMKQIGARQEAGRIGGIGPCGRPLCCSSWMSSFVSVATSAARYQEISLNPQKLAGQCAKLKCCMNFEVDAYVEAQKGIPSKDIPLETKDATFYHFKTDVFGGIMQYSSSPSMAANIVSVPVERVKEIMALNKQGIKVDSLLLESGEQEKVTDYENVVGQDSLTRFDRKKKNKKPSKKGNQNPSQESTDNQNREQQVQGDENNQPQNREPQQGAPQEGENRQQGNRRRDDRNNRNRNRHGGNRENRNGEPRNMEGQNPEGGENQTPRRNDGQRNDGQRNDGQRNDGQGPRNPNQNQNRQHRDHDRERRQENGGDRQRQNPQNGGAPQQGQEGRDGQDQENRQRRPDNRRRHNNNRPNNRRNDERGGSDDRRNGGGNERNGGGNE
ncbi:MAG: hypothetical protein MJZ33_02620 [Paludibacteraceae bacterium]|nr:hypothetical protein [Paludibacteraceae bacterium]